MVLCCCERMRLDTGMKRTQEKLISKLKIRTIFFTSVHRVVPAKALLATIHSIDSDTWCKNAK